MSDESTKGKALAKKIIFKMKVTELELGSTPNRAKYKHFKTKSSTNLANFLDYAPTIFVTIELSHLLLVTYMNLRSVLILNTRMCLLWCTVKLTHTMTFTWTWGLPLNSFFESCRMKFLCKFPTSPLKH